MLVKSIAAVFLAGVAIAAPALDSELSAGTTLYDRQEEYKPCIVNEPKCCPNNFIGFTLRGFPTLKCEDPAAVTSQDEFLASCKDQTLIPYCCTPKFGLFGSFCTRLLKQ
ncbi:hypothetical protein CC79DRAFT_1337365 [Sarocladium strictum]